MQGNAYFVPEMKIRIKGNSIRLRLSQSDMVVFKIQGILEEHTYFPEKKVFTYRLRQYEGKHFTATVSDNCIEVLFPSSRFREWVDTDKVGFQVDQNIGDGTFLSMIVEKDWQCLKPRGENESDLFPNPNKKDENQ